MLLTVEDILLLVLILFREERDTFYSLVSAGFIPAGPL